MKLRKTLLTALCTVFLLSAMLLPAYAAESAHTKVCLNVSASETLPTLLDVTVPSEIVLTATAGSTDLTADKDYFVKNNADAGGVLLVNVCAAPADGWELMPFDTDFSAMLANTRKLAIFTGNQDLSGSGTTLNSVIAPHGTEIMPIAGKTALVTSAIRNQPVAHIIATFSLTAV